jgi:hypothetical protein
MREHDYGSIAILMKALKLTYPIVNEVFQQFRQQLLVEVKRTVTNDYIFNLTATGHQLAAARSHNCRYCGPAPVPLQQYVSVVRQQRASLLPTREMLRTAFEDLVLPDDVLEQFGPALVSGKPIFIYGPPGNGKTSVSERLGTYSTISSSCLTRWKWTAKSSYCTIRPCTNAWKTPQK